MNQTIGRLEKMEEREHTTLMRILFGVESPTPAPKDSEAVSFFDTTLNDSQKDAVRFALAQREVALIHGPPGVCLPSWRMGSKLISCRQVKRTP